jgi:hypothetical protein
VDLETVDASDDGKGTVFVDVGFEPTQVLPVGDVVQLEFDTDRNVATGDESGGDYGLLLLGTGGPNPVGFAFFKWSGSDFVQVHVDSLVTTWSLGHVAMKIAASDLGGTTGFDFWVLSVHGDTPQPGAADLAPDRGFWTYGIGDAQTATLSITGPVGALKARAGKRYSIAFIVASVSGAPLTTLQLACHASIAGKTISGRAGFGGTATRGVATCSLKLPKRARGKVLKGVLDLTFEGVTNHQTFSARVH